MYAPAYNDQPFGIGFEGEMMPPPGPPMGPDGPPPPAGPPGQPGQPGAGGGPPPEIGMLLHILQDIFQVHPEMVPILKQMMAGAGPAGPGGGEPPPPGPPMGGPPPMDGEILGMDATFDPSKLSFDFSSMPTGPHGITNVASTHGGGLHNFPGLASGDPNEFFQAAANIMGKPGQQGRVGTNWNPTPWAANVPEWAQRIIKSGGTAADIARDPGWAENAGMTGDQATAGWEDFMAKERNKQYVGTPMEKAQADFQAKQKAAASGPPVFDWTLGGTNKIAMGTAPGQNAPPTNNIGLPGAGQNPVKPGDKGYMDGEVVGMDALSDLLSSLGEDVGGGPSGPPPSPFGRNLGAPIKPWLMPYTGARTQPMDPTSGMSMQMLIKMLQGGPSFTAKESPYLDQAQGGAKALHDINDADALKRIASSMAAGGLALSGARSDAEQKYTAGSNAAFEENMGKMRTADWENTQGLNVGVAEADANRNLTGMRDLFGMGDTARQVGQGNMDRTYSDWLRQVTGMKDESRYPDNLALGILGSNRNTAHADTYNPSSFENLLRLLGASGSGGSSSLNNLGGLLGNNKLLSVGDSTGLLNQLYKLLTGDTSGGDGSGSTMYNEPIGPPGETYGPNDNTNLYGGYTWDDWKNLLGGG